MTRQREEDTEKYAGGGNVTARGICGGTDAWDSFRCRLFTDPVGHEEQDKHAGRINSDIKFM
jgi:hypothetical protein